MSHKFTVHKKNICDTNHLRFAMAMKMGYWGKAKKKHSQNTVSTKGKNMLIYKNNIL